MIRILISLLVLVLFSCKTSKGIDLYQESQIEIDLLDGVSAKKMEVDFELYGLKLICRASVEKNVGIYEFDNSFSTRDVLIELLNSEKGVEAVRKTKGCVY